MGIKSSEKQEAINRQDFLWRHDRNNWHNVRAKEMRKKYDIKSLEGNDPTSLFYFIALSAAHTAIAYFISQYFKGQFLYIFFLAWIIGGFFACAAGLAIHEAAHGLVFKTKMANYFCGMIAELPLFIPAYLSFRHYHLPHHSYVTIDLGEKNDPNLDDNKQSPKYDSDLPTKFEAALFSTNWFTRLIFITF